MKKFTLLIASLFITIGAMAQFEAGTEYRIKVVGGNADGQYVTIGDAAARSYGYVHSMASSDGNNDQIFSFVSSNGNWKVKSKNDEWISCKNNSVDPWNGWNVNKTTNEAEATELIFESTGNINEYYLRANTSTYFKVAAVDGGASSYNHLYYDAPVAQRAIFLVEKANAEVFTIVYNYTYNDVVVKSVTHEVVEGTGYPSTDLGLFGVIVDDSTKPEGTVSADGEYTFSVTFNMPFEYADSYENVDTWYYAVINSTGHVVETGALGDGKYMKAGTSDIPATVQTFAQSEVDAYSWGFVGDPINGFKMVSKGGKAIKTNNQASTNAELVDIAQGTVFTVKNPENAVPNRPDAFCLLNTSNYLNLQSGYVKQWTSADRGSTILLTQRDFDVTISDLGYATLFLDRKVYIPEGVEAYIVKSDGLNDDYITLTQVTGILPKNTGVILKNTDEYEFITAVENATADVAGNLLTGSAEDVYVEGAAYVLSAPGGAESVGLYPAKLNKNATGGEGETHFLNNANKAYLPAVAGAANVASYSFRFGEGTTGVEKVEIRNEKSEIYDLTGRKIENITAPGIYVVGGKKVLVK